MTRVRWFSLLGIGLISVLLAFLLRDVVYDVVIIPLAYLLWLAKYYYSAIPQLVLWSVLLSLLFLAVLWTMIPEGRPSSRMELRRPPPDGPVEALAVWLVKARTGNYFKWQLANRLGKIARRLSEGSAALQQLPSGGEAVDEYLDAGLNYSFVDFPTPRTPFERARHTPLDLDPRVVADYLESQMENTSGRRG
jgi:hypothetical protein